MKLLFWVIIVPTLIATIGSQPTKRPLKVLSVCEVLRDDPTRLNGKEIAVRGIMDGSDEGAWLTGTCGVHLRTKGIVWPNALWIEVDESDANALRKLASVMSHK